MKVELALLVLFAAWCASPIAGAQTPPAEEFEKLAPAVGAKAYSCVDPSSPLARRPQDEPCRWPHVSAAVRCSFWLQRSADLSKVPAASGGTPSGACHVLEA